MIRSIISLLHFIRAAKGAALLLVLSVYLLSGQVFAQTVLSSPPSITNAPQMSAMFFGLLIGVVLAAAAYLFFIWIAMRDKGQVFLLIFLLCLAANIASTSDLLMGSIGIYDPLGRNFLSNISTIASWIFGLYFTYYFLELDTNSPAYKVPFVLIGIILLLVLSASLFDPAMIHFVMPSIGTLTLSAILIAGISGIRQGTSGSLVHIIAFTCFLGGVLTDPAYALGFIETADGAHEATYIAFALSAMMFAIVVASQFAARQEEK